MRVPDRWKLRPSGPVVGVLILLALVGGLVLLARQGLGTVIATEASVAITVALVEVAARLLRGWRSDRG